MVERKRLRGSPPASEGNYFTSRKEGLEFISTGSKLLDMALGGGWVEGRIANIVGDKSSGKTLLCIEATANFAKKHPKGQILYRECEAAFDPGYAAALGMDLKRVDFGQPLETVEDMFEDLSKVIEEADGPILYIVDSLDALSDRSEMDRDMDQGSYGAEKAKKMSQLFRRLTSQMSRSKVTLLVVSQVRSKIGLSFGRTTTRSGGRALDFYASQVLFLAQTGTITRTASKIKRVVGIDIRAKVDKNKVGFSHRDANFSIIFGYGIDDVPSCLEWLADANALSDVDITASGKSVKEQNKAISDYLSRMARMDDDEYHAEMERVYQAVENRWYEVESRFLPKRKKYG